MAFNIIRIALALVIAVVGGAWSAKLAIDRSDDIAAIHFNDWRAIPGLGTEATDPYSRARIARDGILPLGAAEGLSFHISRDSTGQAIRRDCNYRIAGKVPSSRFWSIFPATPDLAPLSMQRVPLQAVLSSQSIVWLNGESFEIAVGPQPEPGNWLGMDGSGPAVLVLNLYDTPVSTNAEFAEVTMPQVLRVACNA
jgi:hypothetical protein